MILRPHLAASFSFLHIVPSQKCNVNCTFFCPEAGIIVYCHFAGVRELGILLWQCCTLCSFQP